MLLHGMVESSFVNGPGERAVVWFQGCNLGCSGCWNPDTHQFYSDNPIAWYTFAEQRLKSLPDDLEGITFSGGDPMQHYLDLHSIIDWIKLNKPKWSIGMFTGYSLKELESGKWEYNDRWRGITYPVSINPYMVKGSNQYWSNLQEKIDFAVMGRYNRLSPVNEPLVTSSNQELKLFSDRYKKEDFPPQAVEVFLNDDGLVQITGFPVGMDLSVLINETRERQDSSQSYTIS